MSPDDWDEGPFYAQPAPTPEPTRVTRYPRQGAVACERGQHYARAERGSCGITWRCVRCGATRVMRTETEWTRP